jgi:hypothetical protein
MSLGKVVSCAYDDSRLVGHPVPAIVARVPGHQRIFVVSSMAEKAELQGIRSTVGRDPVVLSAPTVDAARVVGSLEVPPPHVDILLAPTAVPRADRGHRLDALVRRYALQDRFRDVVVVTDQTTSRLLVGTLAPDGVPTEGAVTVVGLPRAERRMAVRRAVVSGLLLGVAADVAQPLTPLWTLPALVAVFALVLLLAAPWRRLGRELLLAAAIAITAVLAVLAGSARFPGAW